MFLDISSNNALCFLGGREAKRGAARLFWQVKELSDNRLASWDRVLFYSILFYSILFNFKNQWEKKVEKIREDLVWVIYNPPNKTKTSKPWVFPRSLNYVRITFKVNKNSRNPLMPVLGTEPGSLGISIKPQIYRLGGLKHFISNSSRLLGLCLLISKMEATHFSRTIKREGSLYLKNVSILNFFKLYQL